MNEHDKPPVDRALELLVYTPLGLAVLAWGHVPRAVGEIVSRGRAQLDGAEATVRQARMIGEVAVNFGGRLARREVDARLADARRRAEQFRVHLPGAGGHPNGETAARPPVPPAAPAPPAPDAPPRPVSAPAGPAPAPTAPAPPVPPPVAPPAPPVSAAPPVPADGGKPPAGAASAPRKTTREAPTRKAPAGKTPARKTPARKTPARKTPARKAPAGKTPARKGTKKAAPPRRSAAVVAADLPIPSYDELSASQVVSRLSGLGPDDLDAVRRYETAGRGRKTILAAIDRLQG